MINRLSHSRLGNISFIALVTIPYFVPRSLSSLVTKYDIVSRAIKLMSPRFSYDNLYLFAWFVMNFCVGRCFWSDFVYFKVTQYMNPSKPSRYFL